MHSSKMRRLVAWNNPLSKCHSEGRGTSHSKPNLSHRSDPVPHVIPSARGISPVGQVAARASRVRSTSLAHAIRQIDMSGLREGRARLPYDVEGGRSCNWTRPRTDEAA